MNIPEKGYTPSQKKYALGVFAGGKSKAAAALDAGYSRQVAKNPKYLIEEKKGYKNAMIEILKESDDMVLSIMGQFKERGFTEFSNKDLISALTAIGAAWAKFSEVGRPKEEDPMTGHNQLRTLVLQRIENQTVHQKIEEPKVDDKMDF